MEVQKEYVTTDIETTVGMSMRRTLAQTTIADVEKVLNRIEGSPIKKASFVSIIPGFIHLNPELIAAALIFRSLTKKTPLTEIPDKTRNSVMRKTLLAVFPEVGADKELYAKLKADFIRYLYLIELNLK